MGRTIAHQQTSDIRATMKGQGASEVYIRPHPFYPKYFWMVVCDVSPSNMKRLTDHLHQERIYHLHLNGFTEKDAIRFAVWRRG